MSSIIKYKRMGKNDIISLFKREESESEKKLKEIRDKNVRYLTSIVRTILFLSGQGITLRGKNEYTCPYRKGNFLSLMQHKSYDSAIIYEILQKKNNFLSPGIQNELLEIIKNEIKKMIEKELEITKFLSVIADETTDVSNKSQLITAYHSFKIFFK